jgi:hypothetical protein
MTRMGTGMLGREAKSAKITSELRSTMTKLVRSPELARFPTGCCTWRTRTRVTQLFACVESTPERTPTWLAA